MKTHTRPSLWFGRYDWCLKFYLAEAGALRKLDHDHIDRVIDQRRRWSIRSMGQPQPGSWLQAWTKNQISDETQDTLHEFCDFLLADTRPRKLMIMHDWVHVYTTDKSLTQSIRELPYVNRSLSSLHHVQQQGTPGAINLKNPGHAYRTYFRHRTLDSAQKQNITKFLNAQQGLRISDALAHFLAQENNRRLLDYHFVDHDDHSLTTMLALVAPGLVRRTIPIVADK